MKVVVAPDSFKGSLSAPQAAAAIARGVRRAMPDAEILEVPLADGGEGTVEALVAATGGAFVETDAHDPLGRPLQARYGILGDGRTAVIEMAAASGLPLLEIAERNPMKTSTFGTGELILDAARRGVSAMIIGIGGSATVDGGTGMARALGISFLDENGDALSGGGEILSAICAIDMAGRAGELAGLRFTVACDVRNPLTGPDGAAAVYGPQKGATPEQVKLLEAGLANLAAVIRKDLGREVETLAGAGAAGGLGAGLVVFAGAELKPGIEIVLDAVGIDGKLEGAELVFTGEGSVDAQSAFGKTAAGLARAAKTAGASVFVLAGTVGEGAEAMLENGVDAVFSIARGPASEEEMFREAGALLEAAAEESMRAWLAGRRRGALPGPDFGSGTVA